MKKTFALIAIVGAALGFGLVARADSGCCLIPQARAAATVTKRTTLHIEGMTCGACATAVKHVLKNLDGIKDVQVSFEEKKGIVTYDPAKLTPDKIAHAISEKLPAYQTTVVK